MKSISQMLEDLAPVLDDLTELSVWEQGFLTNILGQWRNNNHDTRFLTDKQVTVIERLHKEFCS